MCEKKLISESTTLVSKEKQLFWINISIKKYTLSFVLIIAKICTSVVKVMYQII